MKIVDRKTFLKLPGYTLYAKLIPQGIEWEEIRVKRDSTKANDYYDMPLIDIAELDTSLIDIAQNCYEEIEKSKNDGAYSIKMETGVVSRDALYEDDQLFCVFEQEDVEMIRNLLNLCIETGS